MWLKGNTTADREGEASNTINPSLWPQSHYWQYNYGLSTNTDSITTACLTNDSTTSTALIWLPTLLLQFWSEYWQYYYSLSLNTDGITMASDSPLMVQNYYSLSLIADSITTASVWHWQYNLSLNTDSITTASVWMPTVLLQPQSDTDSTTITSVWIMTVLLQPQSECRQYYYSLSLTPTVLL